MVSNSSTADAWHSRARQHSHCRLDRGRSSPGWCGAAVHQGCEGSRRWHRSGCPQALWGSPSLSWAGSALRTAPAGSTVSRAASHQKARGLVFTFHTGADWQLACMQQGTMRVDVAGQSDCGNHAVSGWQCFADLWQASMLNSAHIDVQPFQAADPTKTKKAGWRTSAYRGDDLALVPCDPLGLRESANPPDRGLGGHRRAGRSSSPGP